MRDTRRKKMIQRIPDRTLVIIAVILGIAAVFMLYQVIIAQRGIWVLWETAKLIHAG